jgi:hypothetical protein
MGFCTLTPGETDIALSLLEASQMKESTKTKSNEEMQLDGTPLMYESKYGISHLTEAVSESHLEASILANPVLLPKRMRPIEELPVQRARLKHEFVDHCVSREVVEPQWST